MVLSVVLKKKKKKHLHKSYKNECKVVHPKHDSSWLFETITLHLSFNVLNV